MTDFARNVGRYIALHGMPGPEAGAVGVALSGGADSVALLGVLHELGYDVVALHCNYSLRGEESDRDERVAREVCERLGVKIEVTRPDVGETMRKYGESVEMACRRLRYDWFAEVMAANGLKAIALGHHREDNVETMLLNLLRTTGLRGAKGMEPWSEGKMRPLLECRREEIERYVELKRLPWITDSTNEVNDVKRNRVRNIVIPVIEEQFPGAGERLGRSIENLRDDYDFMREQLDRLVNECATPDGGLDLRRLKVLTACGHHAVRHHGASHGMTMEQAREVVVSADSSGKWWRMADGVTAYNDHGVLRYAADDQEGNGIVFTDFNDPRLREAGLTVEWLTREELDERGLKAPKGTIYLDAESVAADGATLEWRRWRQGDRIQPFGMGGRSRLVSDIMNDAHLSLEDKRGVRVLVRNGVVLWAAPLRGSVHHAVTDGTRMVIGLRVERDLS